MVQAQILEDTPVPVKMSSGEESQIRVFTLTLNGVIVELSSLGASITKLLLPQDNGSGHDDVVLGYQSPKEMYESRNPPYFCSIVGRVANRIAKGKFTLDDTTYELTVNNGPNHLHGGEKGFDKCIWDAHIVDVSDRNGAVKGVKFDLLSPHGDQGYPGTVSVSATYALVSNEDTPNSATLRLQMKAELKDDKPTPINLAQHTYFNLASHNHPEGILDHKLTLNCESYTPTDTTTIPTREVVNVQDDYTMNLMGGRLMRDALETFGVEKAKVDESAAKKHVTELSRRVPEIAKSSGESPTPHEPYGFDHNYVVPGPGVDDQSRLSLVGTLEHEESKRRLKVYTNAPGVQVYTANYLDGTSPKPQICKEGASYGQWQAVCLETQCFPGSILSTKEECGFPEFAKGKCHILRPGGPNYEQTVEYSFESLA